ncbi:MAG TPA: GntG family PLP-dependent aldolase [Egibacteraceae bacterium]|nr:GntG family PLP-dependent aldolase [Egibacteraceae bacterium]
MIDLRSDTVTKPTPQMRRAMAEAEVGDEVYREDPTVRRLEEQAAALLGREAALYCPTGVMCNQIWLRLLARPGTEVVVEGDSHLVNYEAGAGAILAGVQFRTLSAADPQRRGILAADQVQAALKPDVFPLTPTTLVWVEQTHNRGGGTCYTLDELRGLRKLTAEAGVALYMDGARVFNAAAATATPAAEFAAEVDGLMFCLSKGLGAPVGSLMVGDAAHIEQARLWRQRYGGGMRQAGVIAAAGLVALRDVDRLHEDHENAQVLARAAADVHPDGIDPARVQTNIVSIEGVDAPAVIAALAERGVLAGPMDPRTVRLVTHRDVSRSDCERAADALRATLPGPGLG